MVAITLRCKGRADERFELGAVRREMTIAELKALVSARSAAAPIAPGRMRLTLPPTPRASREGSGTNPRTGSPSRRKADGAHATVDVTLLDDTRTLESYGIKDGSIVCVKDLGPQVSWTLVFLVEYFGPIAIHVLMYYVLGRLRAEPYGAVQRIAFACVLAHFFKREAETLFVHRFSLATMPLANLFKNCGHYWLLSGVLLAYGLYSPGYVAPGPHEPAFYARVVPALCLFVFAELGNLNAHIVLRNLRPEGTTRRAIPRGGLFEYVSCPNYTFEILAWLAFAWMTMHPISWLFAAVSAIQMYVWAAKKHQRYLREFPGYPKSRRALVPFVL